MNSKLFKVNPNSYSINNKEIIKSAIIKDSSQEISKDNNGSEFNCNKSIQNHDQYSSKNPHKCLNNYKNFYFNLNNEKKESKSCYNNINIDCLEHTNNSKSLVKVINLKTSKRITNLKKMNDRFNKFKTIPFQNISELSRVTFLVNGTEWNEFKGDFPSFNNYEKGSGLSINGYYTNTNRNHENDIKRFYRRKGLSEFVDVAHHFSTNPNKKFQKLLLSNSNVFHKKK